MKYFNALKDAKDVSSKTDLLTDIVVDYEANIKKMSSVGDKERKVKLHTLHAYARKEAVK